MKTQTIAAAALALACAGPLQAAPVTFGFSGAVTQIPVDDPGGGIAIDTVFTGQYTFETTTADGIADASQGSYSWFGPGFGMSVQIGTNSYGVSGSLNIGISNDIGAGGVDQYTVLADDGTLSLELFLEDLTGAVFAGDGLPALPPPLAAFAVLDFHLIDTSLGQVQIDGQINSLTCLLGCGGTPAPEPGTLALVAAGLLAGALRRCRIA